MLFTWSRAVRLRETERQFRDTADQRLLGTVYADWRMAQYVQIPTHPTRTNLFSEDQQKARDMFEKRLKSSALCNWLKRRQKHKARLFSAPMTPSADSEPGGRAQGDGNVFDPRQVGGADLSSRVDRIGTRATTPTSTGRPYRQEGLRTDPGECQA